MCNACGPARGEDNLVPTAGHLAKGSKGYPWVGSASLLDFLSQRVYGGAGVAIAESSGCVV
jgi:hypothetical protein